MTKFRDLRKRLPARSKLLTAPLLTRVDPRVRSRNCLAHGNFLSSGMRRSRTAAIGITHALTLCGRALGAYHYSSPAFTISTQAASAANRGILRKIAILLVSEIIFPSSVGYRRHLSCTSGYLCFGQRFCVANAKSLSSCVRRSRTAAVCITHTFAPREKPFVINDAASRGLGDARKASPAVTVFDGYVKNRSSRRAHAIQIGRAHV